MSNPNIRISGDVHGNVQIGDNNTATYHADNPAASPELRDLRAAVDALRAQLRAAQGVDEADARIAEETLDEVATAGPPTPGKLRRALATLTGALASAASLAGAIETLRKAAAPWM